MSKPKTSADRTVTQPSTDGALDDAWSRLLSLLIARRNQLFDVLRDHQLTPPHGHMLSMLIDGPMRMRDIAEFAACDASYVTVIVDRLERGGLVERRPSATDRRVKEIALTSAGRAVAHEITQVFETPPPELLKLTAIQTKQFVELMKIVVPVAHPVSRFMTLLHRPAPGL